MAEHTPTPTHAPFDHEDPQDIVPEMFRRQIVAIALDADKITLYRDLPLDQQLECFIAGALTGIVCVAFASVSADGYDYVMQHIADCLPFARKQAETVRSPTGEILGNPHNTTLPMEAP